MYVFMQIGLVEGGPQELKVTDIHGEVHTLNAEHANCVLEVADAAEVTVAAVVAAAPAPAPAAEPAPAQ